MGLPNEGYSLACILRACHSGSIRFRGDVYGWNVDQRRLALAASVVRHADGLLSSARRARLTFSKISEARAVQMKGLGFLLWRSM